jgi:hypothetical protein
MAVVVVFGRIFRLVSVAWKQVLVFLDFDVAKLPTVDSLGLKIAILIPLIDVLLNCI